MHICNLNIIQKIPPVVLINKLTDSITSMNASFFRYFMSDLRHEVAPVA